MLLDEVFPERDLGLCPERGPILPAGVGESSWASGSWAGARGKLKQTLSGSKAVITIIRQVSGMTQG